MTPELRAKHVLRDNTRSVTLSHALTVRLVKGTRTRTQPQTANSVQMVATLLPGPWCAQRAVGTRLITISIHRRPVKAVRLDPLRQMRKRPHAPDVLRVSSTTIGRGR